MLVFVGSCLSLIPFRSEDEVGVVLLVRMTLTTFALLFAAGSLGAAEQWGVAPDGTVWTGHSRRFINAPTFAFEPVAGALSYVSEVIDDFHDMRNVTNDGPVVSLGGVWRNLPVGYVTVICRGVGRDGKVIGEGGRRTVWKKASFDPMRYEKAKLDYGLARTRIFESYLGLEQTRHLAKTGEIDLDSYPLNGYPSKMLSAEIVGICDFIASKTMSDADSEPLKDLARKAGDFLIGYSVPAGGPLEFLPRTYHERGSEYGRFKGEQDRIFLVYPAKAGLALIVLFRTVKDCKYLEAAKRIARTYLKLQEKDGTWPVQLNATTMERYSKNRLVPLECMLFLEALYAETGDGSYRAASDRAFGFLENGPLRDWNWEGQFEDGANGKVTTHKNLSNFPANMMASYLVRRFPNDPVRLAQAEELCRFVEDQFVDWEPPYAHGRSADEYGCADDGTWKWFCAPTDHWCTPVVLEQYSCYVPVSASSAKTIHTLLDMYEVTRKTVYIDKARALADAQTRMVEEDGFINTWSVKGVRRDDHRHHMWINCTMEIMTALGRLSELEKQKSAR